MSALPPVHMRLMREAAQAASPSDAALSDGSLSALADGWAGLQAKGVEVGELAALSSRAETIDIAALLAAATPWQCEVAARGIEDADAMLSLGLQALDTLVDRGAPTEAPALALWREFHHASEAVLHALTPQKAAA